MKRTLTLLAILAAIGPAWGQAVVSSNIVGYNKLKIENTTGYLMIAPQFVPVGATAADYPIDIQDVFVDSTFPDPVLDASGEDIEWGAKLMLWNGVGYDTYCWTGKTGEEFFENPAWDDKWTGNFGEYLANNVTIAPGQGVFLWVKDGTAGTTATVAGEVINDASMSVALASGSTGYNMIANPYPKAVAVNDLMTVTGLTGVDWTFETEAGDSLMIWSPEEQAYSVELLYAGDSDPDGMMEGFGAEPGTWFDMGNFKTAEDVIPVGGAFWVKTSGTGTLTFKYHLNRKQGTRT